MIEFRGRGILLDIEGTTSSISFVHDVMFPFVREHLDRFLDEHVARPDVVKACDQIACDAGQSSLADWIAAQPDCGAARNLIRAEVVRLMDRDEKATGLKALQGLIWEGGFRSGQLRSHVFPDVLPAIERWRASGIDIRIFSSGSIAAQKLFFSHVAEPIVADRSAGRSAQPAGGNAESAVHIGPTSINCLHFFSAHYDTTIGSKKDSASYTKIAADWHLPPHEILFLSDLSSELDAAAQTGFQTVATLRPGNAPLPPMCLHAQISSFDEISIAIPENRFDVAS